MKKVLLVLLALIMVLSTMTAAFAGVGNGTVPPGQAKQIFKTGLFEDIESVEEWAGDAIYSMAEKGVIKGDGNGNFLPNKSINHGEVVTMLIRMLELELAVDEDAILPEWLDEEDVDSWMYGYIALADEIFGENDGFRSMMKPNTPVKREEIAQYIKWIIDNEGDISAEISGEVESMFVDADEMDSAKVEAVKLMKSKGLMIGYNHKFQPKKPVTRAQFTLIIQRLFNLEDFEWIDIDSDEYNYIKGIVKDIDKSDEVDSDTIELEDESIHNIDDDVDISGEDDEDSLNDINTGDYVKLKINDEDLVVAIHVYGDDPDNYTAEGNLEDFDDNDDLDWIEVELDEDMIETFSNITDEAIILVGDINDDDLELEEELLDLDIEVEVEDGDVIKIEVKNIMYGSLDYLDFEDEDNDLIGVSIIPEFENYERYFEISDSFKLYIIENGDPERISFNDIPSLELSDNCELKAKFNIELNDEDKYELELNKLYIYQ
jgi:hypothetical protein